MATLEHVDLPYVMNPMTCGVCLFQAYLLVCRVTVDHEGPREIMVTMDHQEGQGLLEHLDSRDSLEHKEDRCAHALAITSCMWAQGQPSLIPRPQASVRSGNMTIIPYVNTNVQRNCTVCTHYTTGGTWK